MGYKLNLNGDEISCFEQETDPNEGGHVGHTSNLNLSWDKRGNGAKRAQFPGLIERERR